MPSVGEYAGLESKAMTETVRLFPQANFIGKELFPRTDPVVGKTANWDVVTGNRGLAKFSAKGAEAHISPLEPRKRISTELLYIREKKVLDEATKHFIDRVGEFNQPYGDQLLTQELEALNRIVENTKEYLRWLAIVNGTIDFQQTDPVVYVKVDYSVAATHKPTKTGTGAWSDTTNSKPLNDMMAWKQLIARDSWLTPGRGYCNYQAMQYLVQNSSIQTLLQYTVGNQLASTGIITLLAGLSIKVYDVNYKDAGGTVRQFIPDNKFVTVANEPIGKEFMGQQDIPTVDGGVATDMGKISYSWTTKDPVDTWILVGDSVIPAIQLPDGMVSATIA